VPCAGYCSPAAAGGPAASVCQNVEGYAGQDANTLGAAAQPYYDVQHHQSDTSHVIIGISIDTIISITSSKMLNYNVYKANGLPQLWKW